MTHDESGFKHALRACDRAGDWRRALDLLDGMHGRGLPRDVLVYGNVMSACARNGRAETVLIYICMHIHVHMRMRMHMHIHMRIYCRRDSV